MIRLAAKRRRLRHLRQVDQMSCGPTCLRMITGYYGFHLDIYEADSLAEKTKSGVTLSSLVTAANSLGLQSKALLCSTAELVATDAPWLLHWRDNHFVVCRAKGPGRFLVNDPAGGMPITMDEAELRKNWANHSESEGMGIAVLITPDPTRFQRKSSAQDPFIGLRTIARDASAYRKSILTIFALVLICMALFLSIPILSRNMVVFGLGTDADHSLVAMLFMAQAAALILHEVLGLARTTRALNVAASLGRNILTRFFRNFLATPLLEVESRNTGDFLSRVNDQNKLRLFIGTHAMSAVFEALLLIALSVFVALHGPEVFISFTAGLGLGLVFFVLAMGKVMRANYRLINADGQTRSIEYEMIEGFTDLKITNTGENILQEWQKRQQLLNEIEHEITITEARQRSLTMVTFAIASVLVNYHLVIGVSAGRYGFGDLVAVNMAVAFCSQALMSLISFVQRGQEAWHSMTRLTAADRRAQDPSRHSDTALPTTADLGALSARNLSFRFPGADDRPVLQDISLSVAQGETLAIVGESGSGKTTLLKLLMHLYRPTEGELHVGGCALSDAQADLWRATCGAVLQDGFLFSDTLRHNVSMSFGQRDDDVEAVRAALRTACLEEFVAALPFGLDTKMGQEGLTPSGGQTQRILLARAVYGKPRILFLDEATSALDASVERRIVENLKRDCPDMTKIIVAHRLSTVVHANSIIVLKDGRIVEKGSHRDLVGNRSHYHRLVSDQLQLAS